jgi:acyl-CoA thioesterase II
MSVDAFLETMKSSIDPELAAAIAQFSTYPVPVEMRIPHRAFLSDTSEFRREGLTLFDGHEFPVTDKPIIRRMWMKISETANEPAAMLAFLSDWPLLGTSVVPFGRTFSRKSQPRRDFHDKELLMMASLDHAMWFHGELDNQLSEWWLFEMRCLVLRDGRATVEGHMWHESGALLATLVQEGVVRLISSTL